MSKEDVRVACPACGQRFKVDPGTLPEGGSGTQARCRGCSAAFVVRRKGVSIEAVPAPEPKKEVSAPARKRKSSRPPARSGPPRKKTRSKVASKPPSKPPPSTPYTPSAPEANPRPFGSAAPFGLGDRLGRYEVEAVLARGGMGGIYKVYDPSANRHVALKVLMSSATEMDQLRFQREIQVQGNIQHPHILPIFDSGLVGTTRYFTMELLKDPIDLLTLTDLMRSGAAAADPKLRPLSTLEGMVRHVVLPLCKAIHHANVNEGVLHRDLKPGNVLVDRNGLRPMLIDFGVSSLLEKRNARLAHLDRDLPVPLSGEGIAITGTLVFMPPEQARGEADRRGDVWALGALLFYLVTGEPILKPALRPVVSEADRIAGLQLLVEQAQEEGRFAEAKEFETKIEEIRSGRERTVEDLRKDVMRGRYQPLPPATSRALSTIIQRATMPNPERRYGHAMELHEDLVAWLEGRPVAALVHSSGAAGGALYRLGLWTRRHAALLGVLGLLGGGAVLALANWPTPDAIDHSGAADVHMNEAMQAFEQGRYDEARVAVRAVLSADPQREAAFALLDKVQRLEDRAAAWARAQTVRRDAEAALQAGDRARAQRLQAALGEVLRSPAFEPLVGEDDPRQTLAHLRLVTYAQGLQRVWVPGDSGAISFLPVEAGGGCIAWEKPAEEPAERNAEGSSFMLRPGSWVMQVASGEGQVYVPFQLKAGESGVDLPVPVDPATLDAGTRYVGPGLGQGPLHSEPVQALLWDKCEVTCARYARFLESLSPDERRRRVPRLAGSLGALGQPMWDAEGDGFRPPADALRRPVEGISLYDARAFARFEKKRLPTAAEWAWAASGPDGRLCALGLVREVIAGGANVDRPLAGVADVMSAARDRSPFGLYDMTGNVAEFTSTMGTLRGTTGWFVLGGSYDQPPAAALVSSARAVAGWMPLQGVGFRCVREP